jgi:hypothetical protein
MEDIIDIIVTETTNTIEITAQPNDEIIDVNIIDNREDIVLNVTPTVVEININSLTSNFGVEWGDITGTLTDQTDLNNALSLKANLVGGKVPASELPSYVDDVVEVATFSALPATGEIGKIYVILDTNKIYRWSGSVYVEIADSTAVWGAITGTLSSQTDLQSALDAKLSVTTAVSTYVPYTGATGDVNLGVNVLKSNNVILDGDTSATGYLGFKQFSGAQGGGLGYSSISATGLTKFYFRAYQTGADVKSFNFDLASLTNLTERNYTLPDANGTLALTSNLSAYVPYTGATANVDLGTHTLLAAKGTFSSSGSADTVGITHSSGSGIALNITKGGNGEGIYVNKSSGSGNAVTIVGTLNATTLVRNGGTSSQFLKADGSVDSTAYQAALTNPVTGTGTSGIVAKFNGTSTITDSIIYDNGTRVSIGANVTTSNTFTAVASTTSAYAVVAQASGAANGFWAVLSGTGEIFRGQTNGGSYFIVNNGGNAFLNGNLNIGDFGSTSFKLNVIGTANITGALSGTSATFSQPVGITTTGTTAAIQVTLPGNANATILSANSGNASFGWKLQMEEVSTGDFRIFRRESGVDYQVLNLARATGAATFSSSVSGTSVRSNGVGTFAFNTANNGEFQIYATAADGMIMAGRGSNYDMVITNKNGADVFRIPTGTTTANFVGNVGIGTTAPTVKLEVGGASNTDSTARFFKTSEGTLLLGGNRSTSNCPFIGSENAYDFAFITNNTERMRITSDGVLQFSTTSVVPTTNNIIHSYGANGYMYIQGGSTGLALAGSGNRNNAIYVNSSSNIITFVADNAERMRIGSLGFTASVTTASDADSKTFMNSIGSSCGLIPTASGATLYLYSRDGSTNYRALLTSSTYFTGQHGNKVKDLDLKENIENYIGMIVSSDGTYYSVNPITKEVAIGKDAISISEALPEIKLSSKDKDKSVWGVVTNVKNDNYNTDGNIDLDNNTEWGDRLGENVIRVNGLGEGAIWVTNINGNLENGDYICSSIISGFGRKQDDDLLHNYSVAKITMDCDFDLNNNNLYRCEEFEFEGQTYKKAFVGCTYHCS